MNYDSNQDEPPWRLVRPPLVRRPSAQASACAVPSTALAPAHRLLPSVVYGNETAAEIIFPAGAGRLTVRCGKTAPTDPRHADPRPRRQAGDCPAGGFGGRKHRETLAFEGGFRIGKGRERLFPWPRRASGPTLPGLWAAGALEHVPLRRTRPINSLKNPPLKKQPPKHITLRRGLLGG